MPKKTPEPAQQSVARRNTKGQFVGRFDPKVAVTICERIAEGETLSAICAQPGMPSRSAFRQWVLKDKELRSAYEAARELQAHSLFEEALDITRILKAGKDGEDKLDNNRVNAFRVALDNLRWAAGKLNPAQYGERADPRGVVAIQIVTPLNLGQGDRQRDPIAGENLYTLKATIETPHDPGDQEAHDAGSRPSDQANSDGRPLMAPRTGNGA